MGQRLALHSLLKTILGSNNVYFQAPPSKQMEYPAIVYRIDNDKVVHANNKPYNRRIRYQVTVIDSNPDSLIPGKIAELPLCSFNRFYPADNLNHNVFNIFF
jgi:hypothetical protein